jgi:hypothetical protein
MPINADLKTKKMGRKSLLKRAKVEKSKMEEDVRFFFPALVVDDPR